MTLVEARGAVLLITLNRPAARNAVDQAVARAVNDAIDRLEDDASLSIGVLAGNGPAFCAGMDLKAFARGESARTPERGFAGLTGRPPVKPLIAAVEGPAFGGGFEIVLACDLVVASGNATFALPEVRRGLIASGGGLLRLPQRIPRNRAMEVLLTGAALDAATAYELGLVNRLVGPGEALDAALALANEVAANGPLAVAATKRVVTESADWTADEAFARQEPIAAAIKASADAHEGAVAFAEKRAPQWSGT
ncbi:crotonase/enoyl-CoA hydratase family protein [Cryptosporangium sp. NPDC048952]|uniref:crotonase/enoyl-CoA hydratase family protein n=1 Tax=Cryptosporangium sp. NPDC048952 TaxID=3363961 RepID=UPI0037201E33